MTASLLSHKIIKLLLQYPSTGHLVKTNTKISACKFRWSHVNKSIKQTPSQSLKMTRVISNRQTIKIQLVQYLIKQENKCISKIK